MKYPIIGITGKARSGKDTLADIIIELAGGSRYKYSLAYPIKQMVTRGMGIDESDDKETEIDWLPGISRRMLYQTLGTEWGRELIHPDIWVLKAQRVYRELGEGMVVPDVRFENEANWIRSVGGIIFRVVRQNGGYARIRDHKSEFGIKHSIDDHVIRNDGSPDDFRRSVIQLGEVIK